MRLDLLAKLVGVAGRRHGRCILTCPVARRLRAMKECSTVPRRSSDFDGRRGAPGRWVLILFALGALGMLGAAAYGLAHAQHGQRSALDRRFRSRAQLGAALVGSLFSASAPGQQQQASQHFGGTKVDRAALDRQATAGGSAFLAIADRSGHVLAASSRAPANLDSVLRAQPMFFRRALASGSYGLSGLTPTGAVLTALPLNGRAGSRVQVSGIPASLLGAFLGGTLKQVSTTSASESLILDDHAGVIAEQGRHERTGRPLRDALLRSGIAGGSTDGTLSDNRLFTTRPVGSTGWRLVLVSSSAAVYQPISGSNRWLPWVILVIGALALTAVGVLLRRTLGATLQVRIANAELERSNDDLERFAYVASHDLSEPLRTIGGFGGLIERRYGERLDEEGRVMLGHITAGAARLQTLIDGLLSYARVSTAPRRVEAVDLDALTSEVLSTISPALAERDAHVDVQPLPTVEGERGQLAQLLQNLILNAVKFTADEVTPQITISARSIHDGRWEVRVADNGVGIAPEQVDRIFDMFQRGTAGHTRAGTGIGLALCARIAERHGGRIRVEPNEGGGSVFVFDLPRAPGAPPPAARSEERVLTG
jgi:signal transduction histidine kinase